MRKDILVLHGMGPRNTWFSGVADIELMFPSYDQYNRYTTHNSYMKIPKAVKNYQFDAIIMMSTFMDFVASHGCKSNWIKQYKFLKTTSCPKIVFAQDDYWFSEVRDEFYTEFKIDKLYSVCPEKDWPELFPNFLSIGGKVKQGYTTYMTPAARELTGYFKKWDDRLYDFVYRAKKTPSAPNRFGFIKGVIGERFLKKINQNQYKCDISTDSKKLLYGSSWYKFVANSKAILGSNSGSSVRLRNHQIDNNLRQFQINFPNATWDAVESNVFDQIDRSKNYTAISPRNLEAAMLGTLQVLTPGDYSGILKAKKHYIPLEEDCSNLEEVLAYLRDKEFCLTIIKTCREELENFSEFQVEKVISDVSQFIHRQGEEKNQNRRFWQWLLMSLISHFQNNLVIILKSVLLTKAKKLFYMLSPRIRFTLRQWIRS